MVNLSKVKKVFSTLKVADWFLIFFFLLAAGFIHAKVNYKDSVAKVFYGNKLYKTLDLTKDGIYRVDVGIVLQVKNEQIRVEKSTCPHKYCVKQGWSNSLPIICVPNKLAVYFEQEDKLLITR